MTVLPQEDVYVFAQQPHYVDVYEAKIVEEYVGSINKQHKH